MASPRAIARQQAQRYFSSPRDVRLFLRQMGAEAGFKDLTSPAGATGYAQFTPGTARSVGLKDPHDPTQAYGAAAKLMRKYLDNYHGDWEKALVAYNAGPGTVGGPLPGETSRYLSTILGGSRPVAGAETQNGASAAANAAGGIGLDTVKLGNKTSFDQAGFEQAQKRALLAGFLQKQDGGNSILFKSGLLSTAAPNPSDFTSSQLTSKILRAPSAPASSGSLGGGHIYSRKNLGRVDMGVDYTGKGAIPALDNAVVTRVQAQNTGTGWPGAGDAGRGSRGAIVVYKLTSGPHRGKYVYVAENFDPSVRVGQKLRRGDVVGHARGAFPFTESGFAANAHGTTLASATTGYKEGQQTEAGKRFLGYLRALGLA